jgi:peptidyl-prolyl cis-trans isomerase B (cyclophilin B)
MRKLKTSVIVFLSFILLTLSGCGPQTQSNSNSNQAQTPNTNTQIQDNTTGQSASAKNPIVTIAMENGGEIKIELYPSVAPNTVKNFISLVQKGFYNGTTFHRVIPGFMIQGGDPNGTGSGGPGYAIKGEFSNNGFKNTLKHERGIVSMARTSAPNSAGSQFFIMVAATPSLDGEYAAFGKVVSGMETVDKVVNSPRDKTDKPQQKQTMKTITVDTLGVNYGEPETLKK